MPETLARDYRNLIGRAVEGLLLGGWRIRSIPGSGKVSFNRQLIRLETDGTTLDLRLHIYSVGKTGRDREHERRIEITSTYLGTLRRLEGVDDVVLGYDRANGVFVGFDPRRLSVGGETHNATNFFDRGGLTLAKRHALVTLGRRSRHFGTEYHAFFEPFRLAEYIFSREDIHAGLYSGGGAFAAVPRRVGRRRLAGPSGAIEGDVLVLSRGPVPPRARTARKADVARAERGAPPSRKTTPEELQAILQKRAENGYRGEEHVFKRERRRLRRAGQAELADKVRLVAREDVSLGYDIRSYEADGQEKLIEVKSTSGTSRQFEMSANEWRAAEVFGERYCIARVTNVGEKPEVVEIRDPAARLESGALAREPSTWRVEH